MILEEDDDNFKPVWIFISILSWNEVKSFDRKLDENFKCW